MNPEDDEQPTQHVPEPVRESARRALRDHPAIEVVCLVGSRARGDAREDSKWDLLGLGRADLPQRGKSPIARLRTTEPRPEVIWAGAGGIKQVRALATRCTYLGGQVHEARPLEGDETVLGAAQTAIGPTRARDYEELLASALGYLEIAAIPAGTGKLDRMVLGIERWAQRLLPADHIPDNKARHAVETIKTGRNRTKTEYAKTAAEQCTRLVAGALGQWPVGVFHLQHQILDLVRPDEEAEADVLTELAHAVRRGRQKSPRRVAIGEEERPASWSERTSASARGLATLVRAVQSGTGPLSTRLDAHERTTLAAALNGGVVRKRVQHHLCRWMSELSTGEVRNALHDLRRVMLAAQHAGEHG